MKQLALSPEEKLRFFGGLALFKDLLDKPYETRPGAKGPIKVTVGDALGEHAEFWEVPAETTVFQEGNFGEHLFFVLRGRAGMSTSFSVDVDRTVALAVDDLPEGSFFGEHSALSMNAHLASVVTKTPALLLLIPQFIVQELVSTTESFRTGIMERYVLRVIRTLVRRVPVLRSASEREFE
ncbi:MAG: Crp/Fnr family transcriptional regulator, partial [Candidatus Binatia bacterium]